jgi:hypothetical protein
MGFLLHLDLLLREVLLYMYKCRLLVKYRFILAILLAPFVVQTKNAAELPMKTEKTAKKPTR